ENSQLAVFDLTSRKTTVIMRGATYGRQLSSGQLLYFRSRTLFSAPFDADTLRVTGESRPRVSDVDYYLVSGVAQFAVASDGTVFYVPRDTTEDAAQLVWLDRSGQATPISPARRAFYQPKLSPDGKLILVS